MAPKPDFDKIDGSLAFDGGVNSIKTSTIQSERNPTGLARNELAWLVNATVRDGGITQRYGFVKIKTILKSAGLLFQGSFTYQPDGANPYDIVSISGRIYLVDPDSVGVIDLTALFPGTLNPANEPFAYFEQAENYLIIQAGDGVTLPLFWNGVTLRRSKGITNIAVAPGTPGVNEIPAATAMDYFMGRLWYAQGRQYSAGDIVGGASGTLTNNFRDAVLNVTESPLVLGGDGFTVPTNDGDIRGLQHGAAIDAALGQGRLFIFTRRAVYALQVPVSRNDWIATTSNNQPLQTVVQLINGSVNDRSIVAVNGDLFYQSLEPSIRSLIQSVRYFNQWGNVDISANERRILQFNDRSVMRASSGIQFDNRMLQTALPEQRPEGIVHKAIIPMDFIPISSFMSQKPPNWEGMYEGVNIMQMNSGDFGGRERAFAIVLSDADGEFQLWEITNSSRMDVSADNEIGNRVQWIIEFPAFTWGDEFMMKKLVGAELWIDRLFGTVEFLMQYRPDGQACWNHWHQWKVCSPKNSCEDAINPICYPLIPYLESYRSTMWLMTPDMLKCASATGRPGNIGFQIQPRLVIKGWCRVRGLMLHGEEVMQKLWDQPVC